VENFAGLALENSPKHEVENRSSSKRRSAATWQPFCNTGRTEHAHNRAISQSPLWMEDLASEQLQAVETLGPKNPKGHLVFSAKVTTIPLAVTPSSSQKVPPALPGASRDISHTNALTRLQGQLMPSQMLPTRNL
jgi:hypothetical protein